MASGRSIIFAKDIAKKLDVFEYSGRAVHRNIQKKLLPPCVLLRPRNLELNFSHSYIEVEPHALTSSALGRSQKAVTELLGSTVAEYATMGPLIVLLDEVETLASDRSKMSLQANPIDVHRATDAVLAQLDQLATQNPALLFLAKSNFPEAIDSAFLSRADLIVTFDLPRPEACQSILRSTILALAKTFPNLEGIVSDPDFEKAGEMCYGLDGRRIRKLVVTACTFSKETAINPNLLSVKDILHAIEYEQKATKIREDK